MLYEFGFQFHFINLLKLFAFILPVSLYLLSGAIDKKAAKHITQALSVLFALFLLFFLIICPLYSYCEIKRYIKEDKLLTVEGEVSEFESPENSA